MSAERLVVFVDYQNAYRRAREAFEPPLAPHWDGQVDPGRLGRVLSHLGHSSRQLAEVRVYRGRPDSSRDPKGYGAASRQAAAWERNPLVKVFMRTLRYPHGYPAVPAQEKGVDVQLAVDFVAMAVRGEYDVGVLMSEDTDLKPALEAVMALPRTHCEVATWDPPGATRRGLKIPGLWCHYIGEADYRWS